MNQSTSLKIQYQVNDMPISFNLMLSLHWIEPSLKSSFTASKKSMSGCSNNSLEAFQNKFHN